MPEVWEAEPAGNGDQGAQVIECCCPDCGEEFVAKPDGGHRLLCGDSTLPDALALVLDRAQPALCLTDPPYGIGDTTSRKNNYVGIVDSPENLDKIIAGFLPLAIKACTLVVVTPGNANQRRYPEPTWTMAWFTPAGAGSGPWGFCCWQPILCFGKDPKLSSGLGRAPDAIVHSETSEKNGHPCPKPIRFWCWLMERTSQGDALVYDPFCGSGTTIMAGEMTGRRCCAIELAPEYVDVAVRRWQDYTGRTAVRHDGTCFGKSR
jgi:DNA modification methylase